jgi:hypothetical protein
MEYEKHAYGQMHKQGTWWILVGVRRVIEYLAHKNKRDEREDDAMNKLEHYRRVRMRVSHCGE